MVFPSKQHDSGLGDRRPGLLVQQRQDRDGGQDHACREHGGSARCLGFGKTQQPLAQDPAPTTEQVVTAADPVNAEVATRPKASVAPVAQNSERVLQENEPTDREVEVPEVLVPKPKTPKPQRT